MLQTGQSTCSPHTPCLRALLAANAALACGIHSRSHHAYDALPLLALLLVVAVALAALVVAVVRVVVA